MRAQHKEKKRQRELSRRIASGGLEGATFQILLFFGYFKHTRFMPMLRKMFQNTSDTTQRSNATNASLNYYIIGGLVFAAALSRLLPHPPNFAPIGACALFAGSYFGERRLLAFFIPLAALFASDLALEATTGWGFYSGMWTVYGAMTLIVFIGFWLSSRRTPARIALGTLGGSALFFVVTNFAVWAGGSLYPRTLEGLQACFVAAIPFFQNSLAGDAFYAVVLFGSAAFAARYVPSLRTA
jgi:hypothetical protein